MDRAPVVNSQLIRQHRKKLWIELALLLLVTFGITGLNSILSLVEALLAVPALPEQTAHLNAPLSQNSIIDLLRQLLSITRLLAWASIALYLLRRSGLDWKRIGLARLQSWSAWWQGAALAAIIGLPGLGWYVLAHTLGWNLTVVSSDLADYWWRTPVLVFWAVANALAEEIIVVGYLNIRLRQLGKSFGVTALCSTLLRASYHLYQGVGAGVGNAAMGVLFSWFYQRFHNLWPLIIAHACIDIVAFVGYPVLVGHFDWLP